MAITEVNWVRVPVRLCYCNVNYASLDILTLWRLLRLVSVNCEAGRNDFTLVASRVHSNKCKTTVWYSVHDFSNVDVVHAASIHFVPAVRGPTHVHKKLAFLKY